MLIRLCSRRFRFSWNEKKNTSERRYAILQMELNRSVVYLALYHHLFPQFEINFSAKNVDPLLTKFYMWQRSCWCLLNSPLLLSVSSPPCEMRGEVLSTSTESGSVIIDVVRQSNPPEGVGAAFHDTGTRSIIDNVKLMSKVYEMAVKGWRVGRGYVMNAWNLAFETINAFATVTSFLGSFRFCSFISRVPRYHCGRSGNEIPMSANAWDSRISHCAESLSM